MRRLRLAALAALCAAGVAALGLPGVFSPQPTPLAQAAPAPDPFVTLSAPVGDAACSECLVGPIELTATAAPFAGRPIASVEFQLSLAGENAWTPIATDSSPPYIQTFNASSQPAGVYDLRAVATDAGGATRPSVPERDRVFAEGAEYVDFVGPPPWMPDRATLRAVAPETATVVLERARSGSNAWSTVDGEWVPFYDENFGLFRYFTFELDTSDPSRWPEASYDFRIVVTGGFLPFVSRPRRDRVIDRTAPTSSLSAPGAALSGEVTLRAEVSDPGGEVALVRFERSPAGAGSWTAIGARGRAPYAQDFDTRALDDGRYDLRVVATDRSGNSAPSAPVTVQVANAPGPRADALALANALAPVQNMTLLGVDESGPQPVTWAYGTTNTAPAVAGGARLPYTAVGRNQVVLLRHTDAAGWQIADVLRDTDGDAFVQPIGLANGAPSVQGQMTSSGEAWIALRGGLSGGEVTAIFHRLPGGGGGQFRRDPDATAALRPLIALMGTEGWRLALRQGGGGRVHGVIVAPAQPMVVPRTVTPPGGGADVSIDTAFRHAVLEDGAWTERTIQQLPPSYEPVRNERLTLFTADITSEGTIWGALSASSNRSVPLMLGHSDGSDWSYVATKLNALDLTEPFDTGPLNVKTTALRGDAGGVWIGARFSGVPQLVNAQVVAYYDAQRGETTRSWCNDLPSSAGCGAALDLDHPAAVPSQVFETAQGKVAYGVSNGFVNVFSRGDWTRAPAPGFSVGGSLVLTAPGNGWLSGDAAVARLTPAATPDPLASWPQSNRSTLLSVAIPRGSGAGTGDSGALAVGLDGTALRYDASAGWLVEPTPGRAGRIPLRSIAFAGPQLAFAVGQSGIILRWDGTSWSEDPRSTKATQAELTSVAFGSDGDGWAVGRFATILHYDGGAWTPEQLPAEDAGLAITSVAVAGADVFAVAGGNLYRRGPGATWRRVEAAQLPALPGSNEPFQRELRLVAGLPDGGVVAAGRSVVITRESGSSRFEYSEQPVQGMAVALAAFRGGGGKVRAFVSLSPIQDGARDIGFPPGEGELLRQTDSGWEDLSRAQYPGAGAPPDGVVTADPVLAVAADARGERAWAVGGYAGTPTSAELGTLETFALRSPGWRTAHIWRYDSAGSTPSPAIEPAAARLPPARPGTVSFAFFSNPQCLAQCSAAQGAQPDVNLKAATGQIAAFAGEPGGPGFAVLGGNARGPLAASEIERGAGAPEFRRLPGLLAPLGQLPLFAAFGPSDAVLNGTTRDAAPWAGAFAQARAPFGLRPPTEAIAPAGQGARVGAVHRYYAFDASQNGGRLRVVVLDNSLDSLEASAPGQTAWLRARLDEAAGADLPVVVILGRALATVGDDDELGRILARAKVLAVFAAGDTNTINTRPSSLPSIERIPQYVGANLGYQRTANNGVVWYRVSVDTASRTVDVEGIPVLDSLALKPLLGLSAARSSTLAFEAVGRRPIGTLATRIDNPGFPGFDNYAAIPSPACGASCVRTGYSFASADPTIGDFVVPSGPGSRYPLLDDSGKPLPSNLSGLFCGYNSGTTTVSVTAGLRKASLPVTVRAGGFGKPCGTVFRAGVGQIVTIRRPSSTIAGTQAKPPSATAAPATPPGGTPPAAVQPTIVLPPAPPAQQAPDQPPPQRQPAPPPVPPPPPETIPVQFVVPLLGVVAVPPLPTAAQPVPPGGSASAQAAAKRREQAKKHASQSALFTVRPSGVPGDEWFFPAVAVAGLMVLMLLAGTVRPGPRPRPRPALVRHGPGPARPRVTAARRP